MRKKVEKLMRWLVKQNRSTKRAIWRVADVVAATVLALLTLSITSPSGTALASGQMAIVVVASVLSSAVALHSAGVYSVVTRFITGAEALRNAASLILTGLPLAGIIWLAEIRITPLYSASYVLASAVILPSLRFAVRQRLRAIQTRTKESVVVYGAGSTGLQLINALFHGNAYRPVALVDGNVELEGLTVAGLQVQAPAELPDILEKSQAKLVLLATPMIDSSQRAELLDVIKDPTIRLKKIPSTTELIAGNVNATTLLEANVMDLLGRNPALPNMDLLTLNIRDKCVLITGAGGSIGSELCRQVCNLGAKELILFDSSEYNLYSILEDLNTETEAQIFPHLGSISCSQTIEALFEAHEIDTIFHTAAYKHVPLVELNVIAAVTNNVFGTHHIVKAALENNVGNFVLISTDKAVRPTNVMGATKRLGELVVQAYAGIAESTTFSMVRFGNVLESSGSVIPKFRDQIARGGPVTVTHPEVTRFFMTIPEAAQLVIQAGAMATGGEVFLLDMGEPIKILDLAKNMIRLSGCVPASADEPLTLSQPNCIAVKFTGLRRGEKLYEELLVDASAVKTGHPHIVKANEQHLSLEDLMAALEALTAACEENSPERVRRVLRELPLQYSPTEG